MNFILNLKLLLHGWSESRLGKSLIWTQQVVSLCCSMTRSALAVAFVLAAVLVLPAVNACGFTTHDFIAHRAREHFYDDAFGGKYSALVEANLGALQGGAPFPGR